MSAQEAPAFGDEALDAASAPAVATPGRPWVMPVAVSGAVVLGLMVSMGVSRHGAHAQPLTAPSGEAAADAGEAPPPPSFAAAAPALPAAPPIEAPVRVVEAAPPPPPPPPPPSDPADLAAARLKAPSLVVDLSAASDEEGAAASNAGRAMAADKSPSLTSTDKGDRESVNERFAKAIGAEQVDTVRASALRAPGTTILQGTVIPAVLETALNTDLPGYLRAIVSQDVKSFDGSVTLIPRGSRLLGQYRSAVARGQSRAFVVWSRLIRPDGASIMLSSPGGDSLGRAGLTGSVDNHFARQFGSAILLSVISAGSQALANDHNAELIIGGSGTVAPDPLPNTFLSKEADIPPTVKVPQGAPMTVFVAKDLDFSDVTPRS